MKLWAIVTIGVFIHIIFFFSVFDVFFATPLVTGMEPQRSPLPPPAKRLVFIVADGLRADKILQLQPDGKSAAPFLRKIIETQGLWGISHAAVPTATRPGHVALTAGFYEDPTSVAKDLQGKEVLFDTVFNESQYTWSWDTPKFLSKVTGGNQERMFSEKYPGHMKYLAGINAKDMDSWVFDEAQALFEKSKTDQILSTKMAQEQILYFLHLGGLDHSGYIVRPSSPLYLEHIRYVDDGVERLVATIEDHYDHDQKTAYVFTSDHGMTDWGAHGDGTHDETLTPLIAWGPGLRKPEKETQKYDDGLSDAWGLSHLKRSDMSQASMAAFLSALVGIPFPMNAVLPVPDNMFNLTDHEMAEMMFANLKQLLNQVRAMNAERQKRSIKFAFSPFLPLSPNNMVSIVSHITQLIADKQYKTATEEIKSAISLSLKGIRYYTTYDRNSLWFAVVSGYLGWMVYIVSLIYEDQDNLNVPNQGTQLSRRYKGMIVLFFFLLSISTFVVLYVQHVVWTNFIYILLPCPIWLAVCLRFDIYKQIVGWISSIGPHVPYLMMTFIGLQGCVLGFYYKQVMTVPMFVFAVWPWIAKRDQLEQKQLFQWSASCVIVGLFPLIPVGTRELQFDLVVFGGVVAVLTACLVIRSFAKRQLARRKLFLIYGFQIVMMIVAIVIMRHTASLAAHDKRTPLVSQIISWIILVIGILEPFIVTTDIKCRLFAIALGWMAPYILLCISYEALFMVFMCWNLYMWIVLETSLRVDYKEVVSVAMENGSLCDGKATPYQANSATKFFESLDFATISTQNTNGKSRQSLVRADLRRAFYAINLVIVSLFGTGNITSVNSFDPAAVFCFLTISNPPSMGLIVVLKIATPFILIACAMRTINLVTNAPQKSFNLLYIGMCDIIALQFFLLVSDEGSWMQVGATISHYVIFQVIHLVLMLLIGGSYILTTCNICCFKPR